jgi:outer membrane protein OmpA-like peptidoglycan-associated protein
MSAQRRETDRETAESMDRLWQVYADEIGIPKAGPDQTQESLAQRREDPLPGPRVAAWSVGRLVAGAAALAVLVTTGITLWLQTLSFPDQADRRPPALAEAPPAETSRLAQPAAPQAPARDATPASAPGATPSDVADSLRRQPEPGSAPSPRPLTAPDTTRASAPPAAAPKPERLAVVPRIHFDFGSDRLTDQSRRVLDEIAGAMKADPDWRGSIEGHTDALGTPEYNQALSERRARAAHEYLEAAGIAPKRLSVVGFGASRPVAPHDALGNALNRRVELHRR